jgi:hypothetical protein
MWDKYSALNVQTDDYVAGNLIQSLTFRRLPMYISTLYPSYLSLTLSPSSEGKTGRIFVKFYIGNFYKKKSVYQIQVTLKSDGNNKHFT